MSCLYCPNCGQYHQTPFCPPVRTVTTYGTPFDLPLRETTDAGRIAALERRVLELEQRLKPLDCTGPDSGQVRGKASA